MASFSSAEKGGFVRDVQGILDLLRPPRAENYLAQMDARIQKLLELPIGQVNNPVSNVNHLKSAAINIRKLANPTELDKPLSNFRKFHRFVVMINLRHVQESCIALSGDLEKVVTECDWKAAAVESAKTGLPLELFMALIRSQEKNPKQYYNILSHAALCANDIAVRELINLGCDVNYTREAPRDCRQPAVLLAASSQKAEEDQRLKTVQLLLDHKAQVTLRTRDDDCGWHLSYMNCHNVTLPIFQALMESIIDMNLTHEDNTSMLDHFLSVQKGSWWPFPDIERFAKLYIYYGINPLQKWTESDHKYMDSAMTLRASYEQRSEEYLLNCVDVNKPNIEFRVLFPEMPTPLVGIIQQFACFAPNKRVLDGRLCVRADPTLQADAQAKAAL